MNLDTVVIVSMRRNKKSKNRLSI